MKHAEAWTQIPEAERRIFTERRRAQGFRSQEHLDAWYRAYDHVVAAECGVCGTPGEAMPLDDGLQPTVRECGEARRLYAEADALHKRPSPRRWNSPFGPMHDG